MVAMALRDEETIRACHFELCRYFKSHTLSEVYAHRLRQIEKTLWV
jgi:hypothetical protein